MVDRRWELEKVFATYPRKRVVTVSGELLLHSRGTFEGSAGCDRFRGKWIVDGDRIKFPESGSRGRCNQAELRLNGPVIGALDEGFTAEVHGNKLTIFAARSRDRLVYRSR
jgi:heat shock protein HslJ